MVANILAAHDERNVGAAEAFKAIDSDGDGTLSRDNIEQHIRKHLVRGREDYAQTGQAAVEEIVDRLMDELDTNKDGLVSWRTFSEWNRSNSVEQIVQSLQ
jgi:Ca2+-binding EF-hand superfamily protein